MSFIPAAVPTSEVLVTDDPVLGRGETPVMSLQWPEHKHNLARLTLAQKQAWYAAQDPQELIDLSANTQRKRRAPVDDPSAWARRSDFERWWFWHYLAPLRLKRTLFRFKFW